MKLDMIEAIIFVSINNAFVKGRFVLQVAGCRLQVEKWTFKSE